MLARVQSTFLRPSSRTVSASRGYSTQTHHEAKHSHQPAGKSNRKVKTGIVLMNLGGPETTKDVKPFLLRLFGDKEIIPLPFQQVLGPTIAHVRGPRITKLYHEIGGSPIKKWTTAQGSAMVKLLDELSPATAPHNFYIAFRYADPLTDSALKQMVEDGVERAIAFTQYPQFSCTATGGSLNQLWRETQRLGLDKSFHWSIIDRWFAHPGFIKAVAERVKEGLMQFPEADREHVVILFSAHSLPLKIVNRGDPYPQEVASTVHHVMHYLGHDYKYQLTWQSAVGPAWLGPQTIDTVTRMGKHNKDANVLVVPIAFTSDHIETLSEIDIEIERAAREAGVKKFVRSPSLNDSPHFIRAMTDIVLDHLRAKRHYSKQYPHKCPGCVNPHCRTILNPVSFTHH